MNDWVVETPSFEDDLMNNRVIMLNQNGVNRVVEIIKHKDNIIKEAINYIKEQSWFCYKDNEEVIDRTPVNKLLEILGDNDE